jgi:REP element-mobilizing transposase RayT
MKDLPVRKNIRLSGYDYSKVGCYYITLCIKERSELLWEPTPVGARIVRPQLSDIGVIIESAIVNIPKIYPSVKIDKYVIMPNHIHMIIVQGSLGRAMRAPTISRIINQMKGYVTKQVGYSMWQKLFHDHIIRNEAEYQRIWKYIDENPMRWAEDEYYGL